MSDACTHAVIILDWRTPHGRVIVIVIRVVIRSVTVVFVWLMMLVLWITVVDNALTLFAGMDRYTVCLCRCLCLRWRVIRFALHSGRFFCRRKYGRIAVMITVAITVTTTTITISGSITIVLNGTRITILTIFINITLTMTTSGAFPATTSQ